MSTALDTILNRAVDDGVVPGAVVFATDLSGTFKLSFVPRKLNIAKAVGRSSLQPGNEKPMQPDTVFTIASLTKPLTTICALQLVERGLISLDEDVSKHIPGLAKQQVLTGFSAENGSPILEKRKNAITLRHLLTHSSGVGMDAIDANLERYRQEILQHNIRAGTTVDERYDLPLIFQPGEGWCYGGSITWAGKVVESVGGMTLEEYMREHIFKPLDITGATFFPHKHPEILSRLARNTFRDPDSGKLSDYPPGHGEMFKFEMVDAFGGEGLYADLSEYFRLLRSLLVDDGKLLKKETAAMMFKPQLPTKESKEMLRETIESQHWMIGDFSGVNEYDWGFGGLLIDGDGHGWRKKGCLIWSGAANLFWFIDRKAGICGLFGTQVFPGADSLVGKVITAFEKNIYSTATTPRL